jgi:hypothetical protein
MTVRDIKLTAVTVTSAVFWEVTPCNLPDRYMSTES